ncbi:penicillin-binding protein 2 [Candidatus Uhrbacteria bacterium]|nr:penicillin-binding protein 2 [Candidatus Uhrbacteria bacterium]
MQKNDPFSIHEDDIRDRLLRKEGPSLRWVEDTAGPGVEGVAYLHAALRLKRARLAFIIFIIGLTFLFGRSAKLQIIDHAQYKLAAETNRLRVTRVRAPRGPIVDRRGVPLTKNIPRFQLVLNPLDFQQSASARDQALAELAATVGIALDELKAAATIVRLPVAPFILRSNLTLEEAYPLLLKTQAIPGVFLESISVRQYPDGPTFAHLLGYLGSIPKEEAENYFARGYGADALVGISGLEAAFEEQLRGRDGRRYAEVNAAGQIQQTVAVEDAAPGATLKLTIDADLQRAVQTALERALTSARASRGAVIVIAPGTGAILAMVSLPAFDNNLFTLRGSERAEIAALFENPDHPLFSRAIAGTYPSGSTIKPVVAAGALKAGVINRNTAFLSAGGLRVGQWFFPDWKAGGHGLTNVVRAIAESINTFFYIIAGGYGEIDGLGIERLAAALREFGFGERAGIELPGEAAGLVPDPAWKNSVKQEAWYIGDTYHTAIGQGDILVTPLQIARMTAYFASSGKWTTPHVVMNNELGIMNHDDAGPNIDPAHIATIREGMRQTVLYGSARSLQALPETSAGKTGTAQWSSTEKPHAWFTGWMPFENPEIVITALIEAGGEGSTSAAPVAKEIMSWWLNNRMKNVE